MQRANRRAHIDFGRVKRPVQIPTEAEQAFRLKPNTDSD